MTQNTRKDPRTKIVSVNIRYRSATVEAFIDDHAHDISRGGVFIKTSRPFATGSLLKFEMRILDDQAVIAGVGRVVWKREPSQATSERPPGMGVKFIKIDDTSRVLIERVVSEFDDAGRTFLSERESDSLAPPPGASRPPALPSIPPSDRTGDSGTPPIVLDPSMPPPRSVSSFKPTITGLGSVRPSTPAHGSSADNTSSPRTSRTSGGFRAEDEGPTQAFFPPKELREQEDSQPEERTVMRQATELLEEALKDAGGSMAEVGEIGMRPPAQTIADGDDDEKTQVLIDDSPRRREASSRGAGGASARASSSSSLAPASKTPEAAPARPVPTAPAKNASGIVLVSMLVVGALGAVSLVAFRMGQRNAEGPLASTAAPTAAPTATPSEIKPVALDDHDAASGNDAESLAVDASGSATVALGAATGQADSGAPAKMDKVDAAAKPVVVPIVRRPAPRPKPVEPAATGETPTETPAPAPNPTPDESP